MSAGRAIVIVLDGCGAGATPDAADYGDHEHPSTLRHVWERARGIDAPHLVSIGFFASSEVGPRPSADALYGRLRPLSHGKDSVTGHWEMMGIVLDRAFPTYPRGFPIALIKEFEARIGTQTLANKPASGTEIIAELGEQHRDTGFPIVYTSADSVFQIACHEGVVPIEKLYEMCRIARELCSGANNVQRVIARPFIDDSKGGFRRTERRRDYPAIPEQNLIDEIGDVYGIGVVPELFGGRGFRPVRRTQNNAEHAQMMLEALASDARFIFANFEDTDMLYGHRNDPVGFAQSLENFDVHLGEVLAQLGDNDLLIVTSDHGNDPTDVSTDHTREYSPLAGRCPGLSGCIGDVDGLGWIGQRVREHLGLSTV